MRRSIRHPGGGALTRRDWAAFAGYGGLRPPVVERVLREVAGTLPRATEFLDAAPLSDDAKVKYRALLAERAAVLLGS